MGVCSQLPRSGAQVTQRETRARARAACVADGLLLVGIGAKNTERATGRRRRQRCSDERRRQLLPLGQSKRSIRCAECALKLESDRPGITRSPEVLAARQVHGPEAKPAALAALLEPDLDVPALQVTLEQLRGSGLDPLQVGVGTIVHALTATLIEGLLGSTLDIKNVFNSISGPAMVALALLPIVQWASPEAMAL